MTVLPAMAGNRIDVDIADPSGVQSIQAAIDLAMDGDVIVVNGNSTLFYGAFQIDSADAKNLVIVGDNLDGDPIRIRDGFQPVSIQGIPSDSRVALRNIEIVRPARQYSGLRVEGCTGSVWLEDLVIRQANNTTFSQGAAPSMEIRNCSSVLLSDSRVSGIDALTAPSNPQTLLATDALHITDSGVGIWGGRVDGGVGDNAQEDYISAAGGTGILASQTGGGDGLVDLYLCGATVVGGFGGGGWSNGSSCRDASDGGDGLILDGADARSADSSFQGGMGGVATPPCIDGQDGQDWAVVPGSGGSFETLPYVCRSLRSNGLAVSGTDALFVALGLPNESFSLVVGDPLAGFSYAPQYDAPIVITNLAGQSTGQTNSLGAGSLTVPVSTNEPAQAFFGQSVFTGTPDGIVLGNPTVLVVLGS